ncbi:MAG: class I SAM-dependent rRNA methyltransferase [Syntrophorhabdales bacterium]
MERIEVDKAAQESIIAGHLWVFSNQVKARPEGIPEGEVVEVTGEKERFLGMGYYNPRSLIAIRLLSRRRVAVDEPFFSARIEEALRLRAGRYEGSFRVVNSESDFVPGLVVDKYEDQVVVQLLTYGMERQRGSIVDAVKKVLSPRAVVLRNDSPSRKEEGLPCYTEVAGGNVTREAVIRAGPLRILVDILAGHKTGFYFDQQENRLAMKEFARGRRVLDLFCYTGGFGLHALYFGAPSVTFVDSSAQALDMCRENARLNKLAGGEFVKADCFDFLKSVTGEHDVIVLDPPSFIKSKKRLREGEKGYIDLHKKALRHLPPEGHLFTFSCSYHMKRSRFRDMVRIAAYGNADAYLVRELSQAGDHPVLLTIPETEYLKGLIVRLRRRGSGE